MLKGVIMSVIFGIKENNEIIIAADKRGTNIINGTYNDDEEKVIVINEHLAFATAGNVSIKRAILMDVQKLSNIEKMTTDSLLDVITLFYKGINEKGITGLISMPFTFLIAGQSKNNNANLISGSNINGRYSTLEVTMALYPPEDVKNELCCQIFANNYNLHHSSFVENTINEIAELSDYVSTTGDKWIYNIHLKKGRLLTF